MPELFGPSLNEDEPTPDLSRMVFFRIEWMKHYRGLTDDPLKYPAGKYSKTYGHGIECWNFLPHESNLYGFFEHPNPSSIIRRLTKNCGEKENTSRFSNATVVWTASKDKPVENTFIVGWWRNATIHSQYLPHPCRDQIESEIEANRQVVDDIPKYCVTCSSGDAYLLPEEDRIFKVPRGLGWMAFQSMVWYADGHGKANIREHLQFKSEVFSYIMGHHSISLMGFSSELQDIGYSEGAMKFVSHYCRERKQAVVRRAKRIFKERNNGRLFCQSCRFDFSQVYGSIGCDFIEAHHARPLSYATDRETIPEDFMMLCSNCHRIIHRLIAKINRPVTLEEVENFSIPGYINNLLKHECS